MNSPFSRLFNLALIVSFASPGSAGEAWDDPVQDAASGVVSPIEPARGQVLAGRVVDGLERPVPGVKVEMEVTTQALGQKKSVTVVETGEDGRFSFEIPPEAEILIWLEFKKEGYESYFQDIRIPVNPDDGAVKTYTLLRKLDWSEVDLLPDREGKGLDRGVRELLASEEWGYSDDELHQFLFRHQAPLRPAFRRLIGDDRVGVGARYWLDLLADPGDQDLFPDGRESAPKHEIREADLVDAIKATARRVNFFSTNPEPGIEIELIAFNPELDRALVEYGINLGPFTGAVWRFVFHKDGKTWVLRSMDEAERG